MTKLFRGLNQNFVADQEGRKSVSHMHYRKKKTGYGVTNETCRETCLKLLIECFEGILRTHESYYGTFRGRAKSEKGRDQSRWGWNKHGKLSTAVCASFSLNSIPIFIQSQNSLGWKRPVEIS